MADARGYAAKSATSPLEPFSFQRRDVGPDDIKIKIEYCGICHSDIHNARNEWHGTTYPVVPGHEIVGKIIEVGANVKNFKVGDLAGVGCLVGSCGECSGCKEGLENYCEVGMVLTYNSPDKISGGMTYGGYSDSIVVDKDFVLKIPTNLDLKSVAPLLCAGITTYSPLRHWNVKQGDKVGVVGLGGLGHMAVKLAHAMGAEVTMVTTSPSKENDAKKLGADHVLISKDAKAMAKAANSLDLIINTIPRTHDINPYLSLLRRDGTMVMVGPVEPITSGFNCNEMILRRKSIAGSVIGGIKETQEMLDFCGEHNVLPEVEMVKPDQINQAFERMLKNDVKYRFVIDMSTL